MSNDLANNKAHEQQGSVTDQACKVFKESSVCAASSILSNESKPRKIFRSVAFLLFTFAFFYQCIAFLCYVLQYPTIVEFEELRDETIPSPAYTFCNTNPIKRSKFCAKFPRNCTKPDPEFCAENPRICGTPDTRVSKEYDFDIDSVDEFFHLNHDAEDMVGSGNDEDDTPVGPLVRDNEMESFPGACFTFFDRVNSPLDPYMKRRNPIGNIMGERFRFDPQEYEVFHPDFKSGIMFQVHSPFEPVNPFETGYFMEPGYLYRIDVKLTYEELLPHECTNYTEVWLKNDKKGYRSQKACKHKCIGDIVVKCLNCTVPFVLYPYPNNSVCGVLEATRYTVECEDPEDMVLECMNNCKDDCLKMKISYQVQESYRNRYNRLLDANESRLIMVKVDFPEADMNRIIHKQQFQVLEIFSLIGGLLAFWIGLSMFQIVEVFDCMFQIAKSVIKRRSGGSERSAA